MTPISMAMHWTDRVTFAERRAAEDVAREIEDRVVQETTVKKQSQTRFDASFGSAPHEVPNR